MSVQDIFEQLGSGFRELSTYDRIVKAKQEFPDLTNKQLADDIVGCPVQKFRKHLAKARKQGHLPEAYDNKSQLDNSLPIFDASVSIPRKKSSNSFAKNECCSPSHNYQITNQYKFDARESIYADKAHGFSIGDKIIVCSDPGVKSCAVCECFDIRNSKWRVRLQSNFQVSLVSVDNIRVFETLYQKCAPRILSESSSGLVLSVERITEWEDGKQLPKPLYEVVKRPPRQDIMPLLYQEKPTWTVEDAKQLLSKCGMGISFMIDLFMRQREGDAKWKDLIYVTEVLESNILGSEKEKSKSRRSLKDWNQILQKAEYEQVPIHWPHTEHTKLNFPEFMEAFGYPSIDQARRKKSLVGLSFDFVPQICDYCHHHATSLPVCECGESFCSPACRLAEWENHKDVCDQALDNMCMVNMIDKLWLLKKGYKSDCEGRKISTK